MEKDLRGLIIEVVILTIFLIISIPICVNASSNYKKEKEKYLNAFNTTIDVNNKEDIKELTIDSNSDNIIEVRLGLMISHFYDEYYIMVDNEIYKLNDLEYTEDDNYRYYIIGSYEIDKSRIVEFDLNPVNQEYFKEHLIYSFYATTIN